MNKNYLYTKFKNAQRGAIMVLFAVLLPVLFGFMGFSIDLGLAYVEHGKMQDIADAAALAGAAHLGDSDRETTVKDAVKAYVEANGIKLGANDLVNRVDGSAWDAKDTLAKGQDALVSYGIVSVTKDGETRDRVRVRITKRAPLFFFNVLGDFSDGIVVAAKAAAEGNVGDEPVFRIIGRNGVYDHFFNLSGASPEGDPNKWIKGSIYAGNMLRASYKQHNPQEARNMISVDGYIFADMLNTGLPVKTGVSGTESEPSDDRVFRSDYVRKLDGKKWLSGFDALTKSDYKGAGWSGSAQELAEQKLSEYSSTLSAYVGNEEIKRKARNREDGYRYICNQAVKKDLDARSVPTVGLEFDRLKDGVVDTEWENYSSKDTNHQYSNIEKDKQEIDVLYVEIQGDSINQNLKNSREGAVWLGCNDRIKKLKKIGTLIVELKTTPTEVQAQNGITSEQLSGTFIITKADKGCEFGAIYSQANLVIRAPGDNNSSHSFKGPVFSEKFVSFSYENQCGGSSLAKPQFGQDVVIAGNVVLFGYGYEIGPSVFHKEYHMGTHHYDDLTNYKTSDSTGDLPENWWAAGITTVDNLSKTNHGFSLSDFNFHDDEYVQAHEGAQNEIELLKKLWNAIDGRDIEYSEDHNNSINLQGSMYGDYGRWPTEFDDLNKGNVNKNSSIRMCTFDGYDGNGSSTTTLKLVE